MTALLPASRALEDQVLARLRDEAPLPMSTPALWAALRPRCDGWPHRTCAGHLDYTAVYRACCRLEKRGSLEGWRSPEFRAVCWRRW